MTVKILEYNEPIPRGATITNNGYVSFRFFKGAESVPQKIREGVTVFQLPPENEYETGEAVLVDTPEGEFWEYDEKEVKTVKTLPNKYMYDVHRRIDSYLKREDFREAVLEFVDLYGCWFSSGVGSRDYTRHNIKEWRREWEAVNRAVTYLRVEPLISPNPVIREEENLIREAIEAKLKKFTEMFLDSRNGTFAIKPASIGGWVWALIYKDYYDKLTYTTCPAPKCTRELPSHSPTTNRKMMYCSQSCKSAVFYLNNREGNNETT